MTQQTTTRALMLPLDSIDIDAVVAGTKRLTPQEAYSLYHQASLYDLGRWANAVAERVHGSSTRTYVKDRNINYTNVCTARCTFCAFRRDLKADGSYTLSTEQLHTKIKQLLDVGGTQILLQGGMHPELPIEFYEDMLRDMKSTFPSVHVHGFSPPEFVEFVAIFNIPGFPTPGPLKAHTLDPDIYIEKLTVIMKRLQDAGLDSIPGGGGEIFPPHVRNRIGIGKADANQWLQVMNIAHSLGMKTSATMMFGHIEGVYDRIMHMNLYRQWQDKAHQQNLPGEYVSFIAWPFQRENTPMGNLPDYDPASTDQFPGDILADFIANQEIDPNDKKAHVAAVPDAGKVVRLAGATEYLRTQAIARLFLDNIHSIGSSWVTMGPHIGQLALKYGANDMGSIMMEENVVSAAGTTYALNEQYLCHLIRTAGYTPAERDNSYNILNIYTNDNIDAPDLAVEDWSTQRATTIHYEDGSSSGTCDSIPADQQSQSGDPNTISLDIAD
ncbi:Aminodeoxyfutalosine synthase [Poriferisphaera corsica]|uniref:Aminodeoxyfutalosine synthase n=1 Tax=Poriferisphaera corsica TaxID=2528020 RepID=A0A517YRG5_9BACT|nr:radical SAM protein [Poriferisphaera corsica]QDU32819.1 Aminodeoxyfutalosine synthase [Poriferisphaera corsica]